MPDEHRRSVLEDNMFLPTLLYVRSVRGGKMDGREPHSAHFFKIICFSNVKSNLLVSLMVSRSVYDQRD